MCSREGFQEKNPQLDQKEARENKRKTRLKTRHSKLKELDSNTPNKTLMTQLNQNQKKRNSKHTSELKKAKDT